MITLELHNEQEREVLARALDCYMATRYVIVEESHDEHVKTITSQRIGIARNIGRRLHES